MAKRVRRKKVGHSKRSSKTVVRTKHRNTATRLAIRELRSVSEQYGGTELAKQAHALELALASPETSKATTHRRVMALAEAAAGSASSQPKVKRASAGKTGKRKAKPSYKTGIFRCRGDYEACLQSGGGFKTCAALFALCISHELKLAPALGIGTGAWGAVKIILGGH